MRQFLVALVAAAALVSLVAVRCAQLPVPIPSAPPSERAEVAPLDEAPQGALEVFVDSVRADVVGGRWAVVLAGREDERLLPIWIGQFEAEAIAISLEKVATPRPLTHDLLKSVISSLGASVVRVVVTDIADGIFYARLILDAGGRHLEIDSRPSDAIALAVRAGAPIFVARAVWDQAGVRLTWDSLGEESPERAEPTQPVSPRLR